jgi:phosphatidylserine decarboxylase
MGSPDVRKHAGGQSRRPEAPIEASGAEHAWGLYGALVGWSASRPVPPAVRPSAYRAFARAVGADLSEVELDLRAYPTLGDFFVRRLRAGARMIDPAPDAVISPCDGVVAAIGHATDGTLIQAKGRDYQLSELLADDVLAERMTGGVYCTIYLSPRDYHRVHTPVAGRVTAYDYLPGALWPVHPFIVTRRDRLLSRNERVVIRLDAGALGAVAVVMVGASGVGHIDLAHLSGSAGSIEPHRHSAALPSGGKPQTSTGPWRSSHERVTTHLDAKVARGDELGAFRLGSTVVLCFEPGKVLLGSLAEGAAVRFGQRLLTRGHA